MAKQKKPPEAKTRCGIYARVSTQLELQGKSFEVQCSDLRKMAEAKGWEVIDVYGDRGISGAKKSRPELERLRADIKAGKIDLVYTKSISRLARSTVTLLTLIKEFDSYGVPVYFEEEGLNTSEKGMGRVIITILGAVAEMERENTSEHIKTGFEARRAAGKPARPHAICYGYKIEDGQVVIDEEQAAVIRDIFRWFVDERLSFDGIAGRLYSRGITTRRGARWDRSTVQHHITNPKYTGTVVELDGEYVFRDVYPKIIDETVWNQAQAIIEQRRKDAPRDDSRNFRSGIYPLSGKMYCADCGRACTRFGHATPFTKWDGLVDGGEGQLRLWGCMSLSRRKTMPQHGGTTINEYWIYRGLIRCVADLMAHGQLEAEEKTTEDYEARLKAYEKESAALEKKRQRIVDLVINQTITEADAKVQLSEIEKSQAALVKPIPPEQRGLKLKDLVTIEKLYTFLTKPSNESQGLGQIRQRPKIENKLIEMFQDPEIKRQLVEASIERIEISGTTVIYQTKQGPKYVATFKERSPAHSKKTGELINRDDFTFERVF